MKAKPVSSLLFSLPRMRSLLIAPGALAAILSALPATAQAQFGGREAMITYSGPYPGGAEEDPTARADEQRGRLYDINAVVITGDRVPVYSLGNWENYENNALYAPMSDADIESFRQQILKELQDAGYLFSSVAVYRPSLKLGFLKLRIHVGEKGEVVVAGNRWYTAEQILDSVSWETGSNFNYRNLYDDLFNLNVKPAMRVQTELKPRIDADGKRIVDVEFQVEDRFPLHLAWNLINTGSKETSDWRSRFSAQFTNLIKTDALVTFEWLTDPFTKGDVDAWSGSYFFPLSDTWAMTTYGGYSRTDLNNVLPELDIAGKGWYGGVTLRRKLRETAEYKVELSLGWLYQETRNTNDLADATVIGSRRVNLSMPRISVNYQAKDYDRFGGRSFLTNTLMFNFAGQFGATDDPTATAQNPGATTDLVIDRLQFARFQRIFKKHPRLSRHSLFMRVDAQLTNDVLPSSLYKSIGGGGTVRGYSEREAVGDYGVNATLEWRTPLLENFIPGMVRAPEYLKENPEDWLMHRLQLAFFYDIGWVAFHHPVEGLPDDQTLHSMGAGVRLGFTKYTQMRFDWGKPLDKTEDTQSGRFHISLQLQY